MTAEVNPSNATTNYKQLVVDVPEERIAEFHTFFGRFLAGRSGRGRTGRHSHHHHGLHGRGCARRQATGDRTEREIEIETTTV